MQNQFVEPYDPGKLPVVDDCASSFGIAFSDIIGPGIAFRKYDGQRCYTPFLTGCVLGVDEKREFLQMASSGIYEGGKLHVDFDDLDSMPIKSIQQLYVLKLSLEVVIEQGLIGRGIAELFQALYGDGSSYSSLHVTSQPTSSFPPRE